MTWRSRICFRKATGCILLLLLGPVCLHAATLVGSVEITGSRDPGVRKRKDLSGVVIWLEPLNGAAHPQPRHAEMVQEHKRFTPHVLAIPAGSRVDFPNFDPIFHSAFSNYAGQVFDVGLYAPGASQTVQFKRPGIVRVFCNIHPTMSAVIAVLDTPYFAVTEVSGKFQIGDIPRGEYVLKVFHERAGRETLDKLQRRMTIAGDVTLPVISISEAGYIPGPHKNKYGQDYPPVSGDGATYPGARP